MTKNETKKYIQERDRVLNLIIEVRLSKRSNKRELC